MRQKVFAFIFARGGSKGLPRKNLRLLGGKPLVRHAIETALACRGVDKVIVSTDDEEIARVAQESGALVPFLRPPELASDTASEWLAWRHAVTAVRSDPALGDFDVFLAVPPTSPLRTAADLEVCLESLAEGEADVIITVTEAHRNPYFNQVTLAPDGTAQLVMGGAQGPVRRQDAPPVFDMTTVAYACRPDFILSAGSIFEGRVKAVQVPKERAVDIDDALDLAFAEFLLARNRET